METLLLGSTGPYVKLIQSLLNRIGYKAGPVDGVYGQQMIQAVMQFQRNHGLSVDGVVGPATWSAFNSILRGYDVYTVRPGDTFYLIARRYFTTVNAIITANPGINPNSLMIGQTIIVPYGFDVVFTDIDYTYDIMQQNIQALKARFPFFQIGVPGKSVLNKNLYYIRLGTGPNQVFYTGAIHANEWITAMLLMKFIENFGKAYSIKGNIRGYNTADIWSRSSIYIMPMINPDGVNLVTEGLKPDNPFYQEILAINNGAFPLPQTWTANIRGVDLNLNFPAGWELEKAYEANVLGITGPAPSDYGGPTPLSEPETQAAVAFTRQHNFRLVIAYHTQGRVIYWQYLDMAPPESLQIAELFSKVSGYRVETNPAEASYAGYKDWFIQEYGRPGFTIEVGLGVNPIPVSQFDTIYRENEEILLLGSIV